VEYLVNWLSGSSNFLSDRSQQTRVGNSLSSVTKLCSSVVQGSVIGPLLFVLFINDITQIFSDNKCTCKLYADDLKLYTVLHADEDCGNLQDKLNSIYDWSHNWQLGISNTKCNLMYIGDTNCKPSLLLNNVCLAVVDEVNDLGVVIDSRLTFHTHLRKNVVRASVWANLIHKCFISRDAFTLIRAFKVYIWPILQYASCTWFPHHILKIQQIETVLGNLPSGFLGTRHCATRRDCLDSLELHWLQHDLLYPYKILFNLVNEAANDMFTLANTLYSTRTRGNSFIDVRKLFFCERIVITWNNLPVTSEHF